MEGGEELNRLHLFDLFYNRFLFTILSLLIVSIGSVYFLFPQTNVLSWDVFGYYLYLPLTFIYNDLTINDYSIIESIINQYKNTASFYQASKIPDGPWVMKYSMGMAVLYSPFFFLSHLFALLTDFPADGFSKPYQIGLQIGSFLYTVAGMFILTKVLLKYFSDKITAITLTLIVLGTNYFHNAAFTSLMPHNYLFTVYAFILYFTIRWHENQKLKYIIFLSLCCGLCILSRPSEIICLLIPALWNVKDKKSFFKKVELLKYQKNQLILFGIIIFLIGLPQFIYWKATVGKFFYLSYNNPGEGFEFLQPYIKEVLFSFRKGWFIYTPIMIFSIFGIYLMIKKKWLNGFAILIFTICNIYIVSSWSCWWYADSFGQRAMVQSYAVLALPLAFFTEHCLGFPLKYKIALILLAVFFIVLNFFQMWQINHGILHSSRTTFKYYKSVFFKTTVNEKQKHFLLIERPYDGKEEFKNIEEYNDRTALSMEFENIDKKGVSAYQSYSGRYSFKLDSLMVFSPGLDLPYKEITNKDHAWVRVKLHVFSQYDFKENPSNLVITFQHKGYNYKYASHDFENIATLTVGKWNTLIFDYLTPEVRKKSDNLKVYVWHRGKNPIYIDDLKVDIYEPKD